MRDSDRLAPIARLAKLGLSSEEKKDLGESLEKVIHWVSQLESLGVDLEEGKETLSAPLRPDGQPLADGSDAVTANAPLAHDHFFMVPRVLEG